MSAKIASNMIGMIILSAVCMGCGGPKPVKISGVLTLNGEPVEGANVQFVPLDEGKRPASGITDKTGKYELTSIENKDGAFPGEYKIVVTYTAPVETEPGTKTENVMKQVMEQQRKYEFTTHVNCCGLKIHCSIDNREDYRSANRACAFGCELVVCAAWMCRN